MRLKRSDILDRSGYLFDSGGRVIGMEKDVRLDPKSLEQAHRYILLHSDAINEFRDDFLREKRRENRFRGVRGDTRTEHEWIINDFSEWLKNKVTRHVHDIDTTTEQGKLRKALAGGLYEHAKEVKGIVINGYKFLTVDRERNRTTQNSGVMVEADGQTYYGKVTNIYELSYYGFYRVVVFRCDWVDINKGLKHYENGGICVNFSKLMHRGRNLHDDPFIFASQAKQVFYIEDEMQKGWLHAIESKPRDMYDLGDE
ncbi:Phenylalanine ammonia-lyase 2 [Bienertia sinuspersici]